MRCSVMLMSAALFLAPVMAVQAEDPTVAEVTYLGNGIFQFKKQTYGYDALVATVQAAHAGEHVGLVLVYMGAVTSELDKRRVCQLRQALQTRVKMLLTVDGEKHELFCT